MRELLAEFFATLGHVVRTAATGSEGRRSAALHAPDVALIDLRLPDVDGGTLLEALRADDPELGVIVLTGHADVPTAVRLMRGGAVDVLEKPVDLEALEQAVRRAAEWGQLRREVALRRARELGDPSDGRPSPSPAVALPSVERLVTLAARHEDAPVLIVGETGTGKGWVARRIHERSARAAAPFVEVNCASLSATFLESELFGHERGAFTDAKQAKRGLLEVAGGGSVFLDEVGELALDVQPRLLKVLEERTFRRLGGTATLRSDARVIAATNQPLPDRVAAAAFRADLFYRLAVLTIALPPLRERRPEIPELATALLPRGGRLAPSAMRALQGYQWPGNVRELRNVLWRAAILAEGAPIAPEHLALPGADPSTHARDDDASLAAAERRAIASALAQSGGNKTEAARRLGIARSTLQEKLKQME